MNAAIETGTAPSLPDVCTVVVIYSDGQTRARALTACDYLVSQIWETVELDFHWWRTDFLNDPQMAGVAARHAIAADFLIVCLSPAADVPTTLETWFASWLHQRGSRQGAMIDLNPPTTADILQPERHGSLRAIALRGNFDYLTTIPAQPEAKSSGGDQSPALEKLPALVDSAKDARPPSRFGLNE